MSDMLVMRLKGPSQSWGSTRRDAWRRSNPTPTKSGVIGLLAAALGRERGADLSDLAHLAMLTRIDAAGTMGVDFQMFHAGDQAQMSHRENLEDAAFVVGLIGSSELVHQCAEALRHPVYVPYLGRKANVTILPVLSRICPGVSTYEDAIACLEQEPWIGFGREEDSLVKCRVSFDSAYVPRIGEAIDATLPARPAIMVSVPNPNYKEESDWSPMDAL